jgi:hypothetical protein
MTEVDVWVSAPANFEPIRAYGEAIAGKLSPSSRSIILQVKSACWRHSEYRRGFSSSDIYSAVLDHGVMDLDGFWKFLHARKARNG